MPLIVPSLVCSILVIGQVGASPSIEGLVVDPNGKPVAGAEVVLTAGEALDGTVPILATTTSGAAGEFRIAHLIADRRRGFLAPGVIWAYRPGLGLGMVDLVRDDRPVQTHRLVLEAQEPRRLTLRDADGKPIVGASVAPRLVETERTAYLGVTIPDDWLGRLTASTDAQGVALLPGLTRRIDLRSVRIAVPGSAPHVAMLLYAEGKHDATLALGRPSRLSGVIRNSSDQPVANVPVEVWIRCGSPIGNQQAAYVIPEAVRFDGSALRTNANGAFQTPPLLRSGSTYRVVVRAPGFAPSVSDWITLRADSNALPPLKIRSLRSLVGRVLDRQGHPIAGVKVFLPGNGPSTTSDEAGRFRVEGITSGRSFLLASHEGFRFAGMLIDEKVANPVELTLEPSDRSARPDHGDASRADLDGRVPIAGPSSARTLPEAGPGEGR